MRVRNHFAVTCLLVLIGAPLGAQSIFQVVPSPNIHPTPFQNGLQAAAASSSTDIWAVGQSAIHYDGTQWTAFPVPGIHGDNTSYLTSVVDLSPTNAWAGGLVGVDVGSTNQILVHWDGTKWSVYPGPKFPAGDEPSIWGMTAISADNIWAVGNLLNPSNGALYALFEHWNGTSWTAQTGPFYGFFEGLSADSANDIWAVGYNNNVTFSEHYDGSTWSLVRTPNVGTGPNILQGVVALAPDNVWAVGSSTALSKAPPPYYDVPTKTLIEHYDGTGWSVVASPNVGPYTQYESNRLLGIVAVSPSDLWAFGSYFAPSGSLDQITLLMKWDGTSWNMQPCPNPTTSSPQSNILWGGVVTGPGDVWIVGDSQAGQQTLVLNTSGG